MNTLNVKHLQLIDNYAPIQNEFNVDGLSATVGELPKGLNGTLYRNGANPMFPPLSDDHHWFLSEGMIHAITIKDGKVSYKNRWVQTEQYLAQRAAGRRLVSTSLTEPSLPEGAHITRHFAATHALYHGGRLLALDEWCGPAALDGDTLDTQADTWTFEGKHKGAFTAHPKVDPDTGEMLGFGYQAEGFGSKVMSYSIISPDGKLVKQELFDVPFCSIAHDFAFTKNYFVFPLFSADVSLERAVSGGPIAAYDPNLKTLFGIMRRDEGASSMRWFETDPCYAFHTMNSYEEVRDGKTFVVLDMMKYPHLPLFNYLGKKDVPEWIRDGNGLLVRWTFDLDSGELTEDVLTDLTGEFPVIDERFAGKAYSVGFYAARTSPWKDGTYYDTISQINTVTKERIDYWAGEGQYVLEPVFAPRSKNSPEGDGWILTVSYDTKRNISDLIVLDALDVSKGPIARVELPTRIPYGFHGSWRGR